MGNKIPNWKQSVVSSNDSFSLFDFKTKVIDGIDVSLRDYKADAILVVNVASKCGLTKTYLPQFQTLLDTINQKFGENKFRILAFPCGDFANQEFATSQETKTFFQNANIKFDLFERIEINGDNIHPIYQYLKYCTPSLNTKQQDGKTLLHAIGWNYGKFLVDKNGLVVNYYGPRVSPMDCAEDIIKVINGDLKGARGDVPYEENSFINVQPENKSTNACSYN